uniref:Radical SAM protein n=1 Tax=Fervidicoccus fontis TaxID=683846 RepID=A0A7J3ZLQ8_9CREN
MGAGTDVKVGEVIPSVGENETLVRMTTSLCPYCQRLLPAIVVEREDKLYIRKECPEHGVFEDLYYGDASLYARFSKYEEEGRGTTVYVPVAAPCPFSCGLCSMHRNHTALLNVVVTNRCNLSCWYCFFYAEKAGFVYEPSIEQIAEQVRLVAKQGKTLAVQLTGGEPLLRDDLPEMIRVLKQEGVKHIQLNITGVGIAEVYWRSREQAIRWVRELREAGVNTVYLSFDGLTPQTNPKNHWEIPFILDAFRGGGLASIVLVPTVLRTVNDHELGDIVRFAAENIDVVRGVNFQPVSLTGRMKRHEVAKYRITIPDVIKRVEEQTDGQITRDAWFPVPVAAKIARFVESFTGREQFLMANHVACGAATYVFVERGRGGEDIAFHPVSEFFDVEGFIGYIDDIRQKLEGSGGLKRAFYILRLAREIKGFVRRDTLPTGESFTGLLIEVFKKRSYEALGRLHYNSLFLGIMHFMDQYNYDVQRVMRCNIHYASPDGRVIPFCTYNVLNDIYRDRIIEKYGIPIEEWKKRAKGTHRYGASEKHNRNIEEIVKHPLYESTYRSFLNKIGPH